MGKKLKEYVITKYGESVWVKLKHDNMVFDSEEVGFRWSIKGINRYIEQTIKEDKKDA